MTAGPTTPDRDGVVPAAMRGDRGAIQALWHEHRRWIAAVLLAHKTRDDQLEDLLQDVAMTIVSKIETLRDPGNVRAWLRTVAVNAARASARARRARPRPVTLAAEPPGPETPSHHDEAGQLMKLATRLPEAYREPLMLRALHGMRGRHIAAILGLSEGTVETRIARARRMLRDLACNGGSDRLGAPQEPVGVTQREKNHEPAA